MVLFGFIDNPEMAETYYAIWCPCKESGCKKVNRQLGTGRTLEAVYEKLRNHLQTSSYHTGLEEDVIEALIMEAPFDEKKWDDKWGNIDEFYGEEGEGNKDFEEDEDEDCTVVNDAPYNWADNNWQDHRSRKGKGRGKGKGWGKGKGGKGGKGNQGVDGVWMQLPPLTHDQTALTLRTGSPNVVVVNRAMICNICENVTRCEQALTASTRVAQGAVNQFQTEQGNLFTIRQDLERIARTLP